MNPIAVLMIGLGVGLLVFGTFLLRMRRKQTGIAICVLGLGSIATPFVVSFILGTYGL